MSLPERLKQPSGVVQFLNSADGQILVEYFQEMLNKSLRVCCTPERTLDEIRFAQGAASAATKFVELKKDILQYQDDLRTGKIKPKDAQALGAAK